MRSVNSPHVIIIGAGDGGLALAQGLKKCGISFEVHEHGALDDGRAQGYRFTVSDFGSFALSECLPAELFKVFTESCGDISGLRMIDAEMNEVASVDYPVNAPPEQRTYSADRGTLRRILRSGLEDHIHFGKKFVRYEKGPSGRVTAFFEDGSRAEGDLIVGADGVRSRVQRQFLPGAEAITIDAIGVGGKVYLQEGQLEGALSFLRDGNAAIAGAHGTSLFLGAHRCKASASEALLSLRDGDRGTLPSMGHAQDECRDYLMWSLMARRDGLQLAPEQETSTLRAEELRRAALGIMTGYDERLRELVEHTDVSTIVAWPLYCSPKVKHWKTTNVTLLGDAIHSMPPTTGAGANTAFRDASRLLRDLRAVQSGQKSLLAAVEAYEIEMLRFSSLIVSQSMFVYRLSTTRSKLIRSATNATFKLMHQLVSLKRQLEVRR